jgi:HEAT repeat protein
MWVLSFVCLGASAGARVASGAPAPKVAKVTRADAARAEIDALALALSGPDEEAAGKAAAALGELADPMAHEALLDGLAFGLRTPVALEALLALAKHPAPPDVISMKRYAGHHNPSVRGTAIAAIAKYPDPAAHAVVVLGLHDPAGGVRTAAADAASKGHVREAIEPLLALLARGEASAARALAELADADLVRKLGDQLGKVPDSTLALCLGIVLRRPDFGPDTERVEVIRAIAKITDQAALAALTDYIDATPKNPPRPSRTEAEKIVEARLSGGGK